MRLRPCIRLSLAALAAIALGGAGVAINDPGCVRKTFPGYFDALAGIARRDAEAPGR